jgi:hypothetical protein
MVSPKNNIRLAALVPIVLAVLIAAAITGVVPVAGSALHDSDITNMYGGDNNYTLTYVAANSTITQPDAVVVTPSDQPPLTPSPSPEPDDAGREDNTQFLTVDFQGKITRVPLDSSGAITESIEVTSQDGIYTLNIPSGTVSRAPDGSIVDLIRINKTPVPDISEDKLVLSDALSCQPDGISFSKPVVVTLGYDINQLSERIQSINIACYTADLEWVELSAASGKVAGSGQATASIDHFATYALIAKRVPASFQTNHLTISPSSTKSWGAFALWMSTGRNALISLDVTNKGGYPGDYSARLNVNGKMIEEKVISLEPDQNGKLYFEISGMSPGEYSIEVGGLTGEFQAAIWINWWLIAGLVLGLAALYWLLRRYVFR